MYFIRMFTINIQHKRRVGKTKGCLINIFQRQVTDKESSYESLNSSLLVLGTVLGCVSEYVTTFFMIYTLTSVIGFVRLAEHTVP